MGDQQAQSQDWQPHIWQCPPTCWRRTDQLLLVLVAARSVRMLAMARPSGPVVKFH